MLSKLIRNFFPPYEVKATKAYINDFFEREDTQPSRLFTGVESELTAIKLQALERLKNTESIVHSVRIDNLHPEYIAILFIGNDLRQAIGSGDHHIYRATLKDSGKELMRILGVVNKILIEKNYMSQEDINKSNIVLQEWIASAG